MRLLTQSIALFLILWASLMATGHVLADWFNIHPTYKLFDLLIIASGMAGAIATGNLAAAFETGRR